MGDVLDEIDFECEWNRPSRLRIEVCATGEGINPDRVVPQEGGKQRKDLLKSCVNAVCHILLSESEEIVHQLQRSYSRGPDWVDELEEDFEDGCGIRNMNDRESGVPCDGLRWLREREHITEEG